MQLKPSLVWLLAVATVVVSVSGAPASESEIAAGTATKQAVRVGFSPAKLFDFNNYKTLFHKTYSGLLEELVRGKYFLSRAFRAFISAIEYKYRKSPYYLAVNPMSDWTREEIKRSENKMLAEATRPVVGVSEVDEEASSGSEDDMAELLPNDVGEVEKELKKMADSATAGEPGYDELKRVMGESVVTSSTGPQDANVRDLPLDKLIDTGADASLNAETARKLTNRVPSNNADYVAPELPSFGLADEQKTVSFIKMKSGDPSLVGNPASFFANALSNTLRAIKFGPSNTGSPALAQPVALPDEVFLDLRATNCFTMPRMQGRCGSCHAFVAISIFEWMYCMHTGQLVPFSEQYMVDCGKQYVNLLDGCEGGFPRGVAKFVKNFGLELRANYPYNARENQCPYHASTSPKNTGFIRFNFDSAVEIPLVRAPEYLKNGPLWIAIGTGNVFHEYGGGVFGYGCPRWWATHAVVLIGHGREDGEEYWLIRNSYSTSWGEAGYGKLAKNAGCIVSKTGWLFASDDGTVKADIKQNELNDHQVVKNRFATDN